jgi:sterol desaturase/sphingolipid hydroxylase (fatty acid hydroxylase superfamily)
MDTFLNSCLTFLAILGAVYLATLALYFTLGFGIAWFNARNPDRRIQKTRSGDKRRNLEIRQSVVSLFVTSFSVAIGVFAQYEGWAWTPWELSLWNAVPLFLLTMVLYDTWFYFAHRLLHTKYLYRFHKLHHRSVAPTPWSVDSNNLVDQGLSHGFYAVIVFFVPLPPLLLLANRALEQITGTFGHAGFEYFASPTSRSPSPMLCTTFHDQHHSEFKYNFANYFSFWDRLLGTISPDYDRRVRAVESNSAKLSFRLEQVEQTPVEYDHSASKMR